MAVARLLGVTAHVGDDAHSRHVLEGRDFVADRATRLANRPWDILHLATHGCLDVDHPDESFVVLADRSLTSGFLHDFDPGVRFRLVVLSACKTALGAMHPDSSLSLTNAFFVAGANSVCSTLWTIPDRLSDRLVTGFYQQLIRATGSARAPQRASA